MLEQVLFWVRWEFINMKEQFHNEQLKCNDLIQESRNNISSNRYQLLLQQWLYNQKFNFFQDLFEFCSGAIALFRAMILAWQQLIFLTLKLPTDLNYYIYQSETIPRRSMYTIRPQLKPSPFATFLKSSRQKEDLFSVIPTSFPGQPSNTTQYVGGDAGDTSALDSSLSKQTNRTNESQSSIIEDNVQQYFFVQDPKKTLRKQLKKEMKKQKIKRKQQEQKYFKSQNQENFISNSFSTLHQKAPLIKGLYQKKNLENSQTVQISLTKIQKLTQKYGAKSTPKKKIHIQNGSAPPKTTNLLQFLRQLEVVKKQLSLAQDIKIKQNIFSESERIIQQSTLQKQEKWVECVENYFIHDLKQQAFSKSSSKSKPTCAYQKLNFIQNLLQHSADYQLPIENSKPTDSQVEKIHLERKVSDYGKKTLLIDLDDTLIFTSKPLEESELKQTDFKIVQKDGKSRKLYLRPYAKQFLSRMSQHYEIIIFTAATKCYADQIRKILDPSNNIISHLLDRQFCFNPNAGSNDTKLPFIKDLRKLNRNLSQTILLDNSIYCFWYQINNGIPIISYAKQNKNDMQLIKVSNYLISLINCSDVREVNKEYFKLQQYEQHVDALTLVNELYMQ